jgi:hypothetical protein
MITKGATGSSNVFAGGSKGGNREWTRMDTNIWLMKGGFSEIQTIHSGDGAELAKSIKIRVHSLVAQKEPRMDANGHKYLADERQVL